jgi:hypothetical protein
MQDYREMKTLFWVFSLICVLLGYFTGQQFDYVYFYAPMWNEVLQGRNPWLVIPGALYTPVFNFLAWPFYVHPLLPKLIFIFSGLLFFYYLFLQTDRESSKKDFLFNSFLLFLNPFFLVFGCFFGACDILVAVLCFFAIHFIAENKNRLSSVCLALATLLKLYPLAVVPLILFHLNGKNRTQWTVFYTSTVLTGILAGFAVWGSDSLLPFLRIPQVTPELLSLPGFLNNFFQNQEFMATGSLAWNFVYNGISPIVWVLAIAACVRHGLNLFDSSLIVFSLVLATFKIGHIQYLAVVSFFLLYQIVQARKKEQRQSFKVLLAYYSWIQTVILWYFFSGSLPPGFEIIRKWIGLPHFIGVCLFSLFLIKAKRRNERFRAQNTA